MSQKKNPTSVVSFSCDLDTQNWLMDYCVLNQVSRSTAIRYLIRMGKVYLQTLEQSVDIAEDLDKQDSKSASTVVEG